MCGIAGFVDAGQSRSRVQNDRIARAMGDALRHRGPDNGRIWSDPDAGIWLSHRRLAIVDLSEAGQQPMSTPDGVGHICYNGELYNADELREALRGEGYSFRGHSDTEVLLYACRHWGLEAALPRIMGMFAFAYWDGQQRSLSLVTDRLGKKPIYWSRTRRGQLLFASELSGLTAHPNCSTEIDRSSVAEYLRLLHVPAPHSIFAGVQKVEPATVLTFADEQVRSSRYWCLLAVAKAGQLDRFRGSDQEAVDAAEGLIADATRRRMISDVPLGALLSGGVDSSTVVALMQAAGSRPVRTFSIGYTDKEYDEAGDAERIAAHLGTDHLTLTVEPANVVAVIPQLPRIFDEPFADASQVPTYLVSKLAREHVTVVLSGDGGDELFAGYNRHVAAGGVLKRLGLLPAPARASLTVALKWLSPEQWQRLASVFPQQLRPRTVGEKIHKLADVLTASDLDRYRSLVSQWKQPDDIVIGGSERDCILDRHELRNCFDDPVEFMRYLDLSLYLPGDILTKVDRASMATSLEVRAPLLDHRLVEFSFRIPSALHLRDGRGKWLLRKVLERHVPRPLFDRPKMGFGIPVGDWLRGPLRDWAESLLSESSLEATGLLHPAPIRLLWKSHLDRRDNAQYLLWAVLMLQAWQLEHRLQLRRAA